MDPEIRPSQEDTNKQINSELDKRSDLILDNIKIAPIVEKLGQHDSLKKHLERGQWLNEDQLKVLNLDPEIEESYSELREFYQKQETMTDDERLLEHLERKNQIIEDKNKLDSEALFKERCRLKATSLRSSLEIIYNLLFELDYSMGEMEDFVKQLTEKLLKVVDDEQKDSIGSAGYNWAKFMNIRNAFHHLTLKDGKSVIKGMIEAVFRTSSSFESIASSIDNMQSIVDEVIADMNQQKDNQARLREKSREMSKKTSGGILQKFKGIFK